MNREQFEALAWEQIDGSIGERDRARLAAFLARHPEALEWQREIDAMARRLAEVEEVPPPAVLRARIDASLAAATRPADRPVSRFGRLRGWFAPNFPGWSPVLRTESSSLGNLDQRGLGRYQAMSTKRNTVIVAFAAVVVVAILVIGYYSLHRPPAPAENAVGATGAAQRYKTEQIKEQDVRLDLKGQETLDEAIFAVLTDEQKADMLSRLDQGQRRQILAAVNLDERAFQGMKVQERADLWMRLSIDERRKRLDRLHLDERAFQGMNAQQRADLWMRLSLDDRKATFAQMKLTDDDFARMNVAERANLIGRMSLEGRAEIFARLAFDRMALERMNLNQKAAAWERMSVEGRKDALGRLSVDGTEFERYNMQQKADLLDRYDMQDRRATDRPRSKGGKE